MYSFRIILACKGGYYEFFCCFLLDCSNAFQNTRTDTGDDAELFCWPPAGFERRNSRGERMALQILVGMQGRIDATLLFSTRLFKLLANARMFRCMWDSQVVIYHVGPLVGTDSSLTDILNSVKGAKDSEPGEPPVGFAVMGWHVDDATGLACDTKLEMDPTKNRVVNFIQGHIETEYATTKTGWHGQKALGFLLMCYDAERQVTMSAPDAIRQLASTLLADQVGLNPKHIMMSDIMELEAGVVPEVGDPLRDQVLQRMSLTRYALGVLIWVCNAYPQASKPTAGLCRFMANPGEGTHKHTCFMVHHLLPRCETDCNRFGGVGCMGLETPENPPTPAEAAPNKLWFFHYYADASNDMRSVTGGVGMLAGGCILSISQTQHLTAPDSHTSEVVGGGTNFHFIVPINGLLQELHIRLGRPSPMLFDSQTTVYVASSDASVRRSAWITRRVKVLREGESEGEIKPMFTPGTEMVADVNTKYLSYAQWLKLVSIMLNK
jgi:hypothetical protein